MKISTKAEIYLLFVTIIFGATFPLIHYAIQYIDPEQFVFYRFLISSLFFLPFVKHPLHKINISIFMGGIGLSILSLCAYLFQTMGMQFIDASRAAFITGSSVLFVPFFSPFFGFPKKKKWMF